MVYLSAFSPNPLLSQKTERDEEKKEEKNLTALCDPIVIVIRQSDKLKLAVDYKSLPDFCNLVALPAGDWTNLIDLIDTIARQNWSNHEAYSVISALIKLPSRWKSKPRFLQMRRIPLFSSSM